MKRQIASLLSVILIVLTLFSCGFDDYFIGGGGNDYDDYTLPPDYDPVKRTLDFVPEDKTNDLDRDYFYKNDIMKLIFVSNMDYIDEVLSHKDVKKEDLISAVKSNKNISDKYKNILYTYIDLLVTKYPDANLRLFYEHLTSIKIYEVDEFELLSKTMSDDSLACYDSVKNEIYVLENYDFESNDLDKQILYHEISHAVRDGRFKSKGYQVTIGVCGPNAYYSVMGEALNSVFAVSLFKEEERDITYQLQSNYVVVLLDVLDGYTLTDYVNDSLTRLAEEMDKAYGSHNYAVDILHLMEEQYNDFHDDFIEIPEEEYYPIYDFLCDIYFKKYVKEDMSEEEAKEVCAGLIDLVTFDVPEEYHIDTNRFYENLNNYLREDAA